VEPAQRPKRILALDLGARRIGLAVSDPLRLTAQGLETLQRKNKRADLEHLAQLVQKYDVVEIVLGLPLHMSGGETAQSRRSAEFAEELKEKLHLPVHLWDERLTSAQANRLLRESEISIRRRGQAVDRMAATLILQSFLEARRAN
jgi:putative Holliday junction resolvase